MRLYKVYKYLLYTYIYVYTYEIIVCRMYVYLYMYIRIRKIHVCTYVSSAYSRCFISPLILIILVRSSRKCHRSLLIHSSRSLSHSLFHTSRSSCVLRVVLCVFFVVCISHYYKCITLLLFFFYIKYRISDDLTKLYPGINVLYAEREGDRSRRRVFYIYVSLVRFIRIFAIGTFNLSPLSAIRLVIYYSVINIDFVTIDPRISVSRSSTACPFLHDPFKHILLRIYIYIYIMRSP